MTEALKTQVCRSCGKELPITEYRNTRIGLLKTCKECVRQNQIRAKLAKKNEVSAEQELAKARHFRLYPSRVDERVKEKGIRVHHEIHRGAYHRLKGHKMKATKSEMQRYLIKEQGWSKEAVLGLSEEELEEIYETFRYE